MTKEEVLALYEAELGRLKAAGESGASLLAWACKGTRTRVHEALQAASPPPERGDEHETYKAQEKEFCERIAASKAPPTEEQIHALTKARKRSDEIHHERQKLHGVGLWTKTNEIVAAAGVTEQGREGQVSQ